jgi:1-deoxy-D-xylulose-5-phosphate reductoisomerase
LRKHRYITLLGSTGSIGCSTLEVLSHLQDHFTVRALSTNGNIDLLQDQIRRYRPRVVAVLDREKAEILRGRTGSTTEVLSGEEGLLEICGRDDSDIVLNALVGFSGLRPTIRGIETGKDIAIANKETLVVAGDLVTRMARENNVRLLPVDSEHSAILQCLQGEDLEDVERLIVTASGGPFLNYDRDQLATVTVADALNHPTWKMGPKITIDSATLMNKGLEVIEACRLFGLPPEKIHIMIHPQSIIHSLVEFRDGSVKAQLSAPDMRLPIQ